MPGWVKNGVWKNGGIPTGRTDCEGRGGGRVSGGTAPLRNHSTDAPEARTTLPQRAISDLMYAANSAGVLSRTSMP